MFALSVGRLHAFPYILSDLLSQSDVRKTAFEKLFCLFQTMVSDSGGNFVKIRISSFGMVSLVVRVGAVVLWCCPALVLSPNFLLVQ